MKITFNIDYRTRWGEMLTLSGDIPQLGGGASGKALPMSLHGLQTWKLDIELPDDTEAFHYRYIVRRDDGTERREWNAPTAHTFRPAKGATDFEIFDLWQDLPFDKPFYSVVFTECVCRRTNKARATQLKPGKLLLTVDAPMIAPDEIVAVCGSTDALGNWNPERAIAMSDADFPTWSCAVTLADLPSHFEYKFVILKRESKHLVAWEGGGNRQMHISPRTPATVIEATGIRLVNPKTPWRGAGIAIPVFSLRSVNDWGVGEFLDLKKMVDWAAATGQKFIQVLPVNDTTMTHTWTDSYPYNANSCFALHPMYLRLSELGCLADAERQTYYDNLAKELNALEEIDYERVNNAKNAYTRELFAQLKGNATRTKAFKDFVEKNQDWLKPYAAYCLLRDRFGTPEFSNWGEFSTYTPAKIESFLRENQQDANYVYWIQHNLASQLAEVRNYAHAHGVSLKGDIPIGISRDSVDAWTMPRLFNLNSQAGAPPDDFSVLGQNWGFPTYNWEQMWRQGEFAWWKARFSNMSQYFDVYRIDHVLGFFRIWQIPMTQLHGLLGVFNPALPYTAEELQSNYDFHIEPELHTSPFIMDYFLPDFFGEYVDEVKQKYLDDNGHGRFRMKSKFRTQRQIAEYFAKQPLNDKNTRICNGLHGLIDQVLFIEDPVEKCKYHPRISAQYTYIYRSLNDYERWAFDRLYNDFFYHRHNEFWRGKAMWKLPPIIDATNMLTCAEDLGMIPDCVPAVMSALKILTLDIQRMPKNPNDEFGNPAYYPYLTVCTTSTHDMGGIRQWWEENHDSTQRFYNNILGERGEAPAFAEPWICEKIVDSNLRSPAMLCILPLQDWLSIDGRLRRADPRKEQINVPANSRHYWRYRMHLTLEDLLDEDTFNKRITALIAEAGR